MSGRGYRSTGVVTTSRRYHSNLRCPDGHKLYQYSDGDLGISNVTCDMCHRRIPIEDSFIGCRDCNIDICRRCENITSQQDINRLTLDPMPRTEPVQACCMVAIAMTHHSEQDRLMAAARGERYNGRRPNYRGLRVLSSHYPDASQFGWRFTGSCESGRAEFFEKSFEQHGIVKLDFYYTTGTVKTVLDHPTQGVTQLFAKGNSLSPDMYRAILENPRHHTGNRYHRRQRN